MNEYGVCSFPREGFHAVAFLVRPLKGRNFFTHGARRHRSLFTSKCPPEGGHASVPAKRPGGQELKIQGFSRQTEKHAKHEGEAK
jgi:hypothetical protein